MTSTQSSDRAPRRAVTYRQNTALERVDTKTAQRTKPLKERVRCMFGKRKTDEKEDYTKRKTNEREDYIKRKTSEKEDYEELSNPEEALY